MRATIRTCPGRAESVGGVRDRCLPHRHLLQHRSGDAAQSRQRQPHRAAICATAVWSAGRSIPRVPPAPPAIAWSVLPMPCSVLSRRWDSPSAWPRAAEIFRQVRGVVSGSDTRHGETVPYITQFMMALSGGPGLHGYDGWLTYESSSGNGIMVCDSVEMNEAMYPVVFGERRIALDSAGPGQWCGAPAMAGSYRSLDGDIPGLLLRRRRYFPGRGCARRRGGRNGRSWKQHADGSVQRLPRLSSGDVQGDRASALSQLRPAAAMATRGPVIPALVCADVNRQWLSVEKAAASLRRRRRAGREWRGLPDR